MDVDDPVRVPGHEVRGQDLHVPGQHHQVDAVLGQEGELLPLGLHRASRPDRDVVERHAVEVAPPPGVRVVADHQREVAGQFAALVAVQEVHQAVVVLRHEHGHPRAVRPVQPPPHGEPLGDRGELAVAVVAGEVEPGQVPLDPHEEQAAFGVLVLVGVEDVGVVPEQEVGDGGGDALAVGAVDEQDAGAGHRNTQVAGGRGVEPGRSEGNEQHLTLPLAGEASGREHQQFVYGLPDQDMRRHLDHPGHR